MGPAIYINTYPNKGLIHGYIRRCKLPDPTLIVNTVFKEITQGNYCVFNQLVEIHLNIPLRMDFHFEAAVFGKKFQEVTEKENARIDGVISRSIQTLSYL